MSEIEYKQLNPEDPWTCPKCGSKNVICHSGMFIDRFECQNCHWDWR